MNDISDTAPSLADLRGITDHVRFILDAKACAKRADELIGLTIAAQEAQAATERAVQAMQNERTALDAEKAALAERETGIEQRSAAWSERELRSENRARHLTAAGQLEYHRDRVAEAVESVDGVRRLLMPIAHLDGGYASLLAEAPTAGLEAARQLLDRDGLEITIAGLIGVSDAIAAADGYVRTAGNRVRMIAGISHVAGLQQERGLGDLVAEICADHQISIGDAHDIDGQRHLGEDADEAAHFAMPSQAAPKKGAGRRVSP